MVNSPIKEYHVYLVTFLFFHGFLIKDRKNQIFFLSSFSNITPKTPREQEAETVNFQDLMVLGDIYNSEPQNMER